MLGEAVPNSVRHTGSGIEKWPLRQISSGSALRYPDIKSQNPHNLKHTVPAAPLVEVDVPAASR